MWGYYNFVRTYLKSTVIPECFYRGSTALDSRQDHAGMTTYRKPTYGGHDAVTLAICEEEPEIFYNLKNSFTDFLYVRPIGS